MTQPPDTDKVLEKTPQKPKKVLTRTEKLRDFSIGLISWYLVNGLLWYGILSDYVQNGDESTILIFSILFLAVDIAQIVLLIILAFRRVWISLGILSALLLNQIISVALGLFNNLTCVVPFFFPIE